MARYHRDERVYDEFHEIDEDSFDDELRAPEMFEPVMEQVLDPGMIDVDEELGTNLSHAETLARVNKHFSQSDLGYKQSTVDSFTLHVRSRKYPLFGVFSGRITITQDLAHTPRMHARANYRIEGLMRYRMSVIWFIGVLSFFFLIIYMTKPGLYEGALFIALASALTIYTTHQLGRDESEDVEERIHAEFLRLRSTLENIRR